jgi:hypothetical protein
LTTKEFLKAENIMKLTNRFCIYLIVLLTLSSLGGIIAMAADEIGGPAVSILANASGDEASGGGLRLIADTPCYYWYNGCGPTALGMIIGYWDGHGYANLIPGSNNWSANQTAIKNMIASPGHITDYVPTPDRLTPPPYHSDDSVADFCKSSRDPLQWGWSYFSYQDEGLKGYADYCGYNQYTAWQSYYSSSLWDEIISEIDAGHPLEFLVDSDGNGSTDHFVTVIGYDDTAGQKKYACWDTWYSTIRWENFHAMSSGNAWGVYGATFFYLVPEPSIFVLLGMGALSLIAYACRRRK